MSLHATAQEQELVRQSIRDHHELVFRVAHRMLRNRADAEDVVQEVYLRMIRSRVASSPTESLRPWLVRVALNVSRNLIRSASNRRQREARFAEQWVQQHREEQDVDTEAVAQAVGELPETLRIPLVLYYEEGLKYREIAQAMDCREGTVAKRIFTAKAQLRERLRGRESLAALPALEPFLRGAPEIPVPDDLSARLDQHFTPERIAEILEQAPSPAARESSAPHLSSGFVGVTTRKAVTFFSLIALLGGVALWTLLPPEGPGPSRETALESGSDQARGAPSESPTPSEAVPPALPSKTAPDPASPSVKDTDPVAAAPSRRGVFGFVTDPGGTPLPEIEVQLQSAYQTKLWHSTRTDDKGYYQFPALSKPPGTDAQREEPALSLGAGGTARRQSAGGDSVKKDSNVIIVSGSKEDQKDDAKEDQTGTAPRGGVVRRSVRGQTDSSPIVSGPQGSFRVEANGQGYARQVTDPFTIALHEEKQVDLALEADLGISGIVTSAGRPVTGAEVSVFAHNATSHPDDKSLTTTSDEEGRFHLRGLSAGHYLLGTRAENLEESTTSVSAGTTHHRIELSPAGHLDVELVQGDGSAGLDAVEIRLGRNGRFVHYGIADSTGRASFVDLSPGPYTLSVYRAALPLARVEVSVRASQQTLATVALPDSHELSGQLRAARTEASGKPPTYQVRATWLDARDRVPQSGRTRKNWQETKADADGHFRLRHLPPGEYLVSISARRGWAFEVLRLEHVTLSVTEDDPVLDLFLEEASSLEIEVLTTNGEPPEFSHAAVRDPEGNLFISSSTAAGGKPITLRAPAGTFDVVVGALDHATKRLHDIKFDPGHFQTMTVTVAPKQDLEDTLEPLKKLFPDDLVLTVKKKMTLRTFLGWLRSQSDPPLELHPDLVASPILDQSEMPTTTMALPALLHFFTQSHSLQWETDRSGVVTLLPPKEKN